MNLNKQILIALSTLALVGCGGSAGTPGGNLNTQVNKMGLANQYHFNCSLNLDDVCNSGHDLALKNGSSGNKQGIKLVAPQIGDGIVDLAIADVADKPQDKVIFNKGSSTFQCDFTSKRDCDLTINAADGIVGKNVKVVAVKDNNTVASIGITIKDGGVVPPKDPDKWGTFKVTYANGIPNLAHMKANDVSSFIITLENSTINNNDVNVPLSFDQNEIKGLVTLDKDHCQFTSTVKTCKVTVTANSFNLYGSNTLEFNHREKIIGKDGYDYGIMDVITLAVPDPTAQNDSLKTPKMVSNSYTEYSKNGGVAGFLIRGPKLDTVYSLNGDFMRTVLENIKQSDPVAYEKDFGKSAKIDANGDIDVNFDEIMLSGSGDSNQDKFYKGNSDTINFDGKKIKITVDGVIDDKDPQSNPKTADVIKDTYNSLRSALVPTIFYAHCTQGMDRTGYFVTWYLVHSYQNSGVKLLSDEQQYNNVIKLGLVRWRDGENFTDLSFNGKSWQGSNKVAQIPGDMKTKEDFHAKDSFWNNYPNDQSLVANSFGATPDANEYAWTLPLCGSYTSSSCSALKLENNTATISGEAGYTNAYVAYVDAKGYTIAIQGPFAKNSIPIDHVAGAVTNKIYLVNNDFADSFIKEKVVVIKSQ